MLFLDLCNVDINPKTLDEKNVRQKKICKLKAYKPKMGRELHANTKLSIPYVKSSNSVFLIKPDCFFNLKMEIFKEKQT